ncbi:hypothetical protein [Mycolicibacterium sp. A43C]
MKENIALAISTLTLAVNVWMAYQNRDPPPEGRHRKPKKRR